MKIKTPMPAKTPAKVQHGAIIKTFNYIIDWLRLVEYQEADLMYTLLEMKMYTNRRVCKEHG